MTYHVVFEDASIRILDGRQLHLLQVPVYAISESRQTAQYNALRCVDAKLAALRKMDRPGVGGWWLDELRELEERRDELRRQDALG